MKKLSKIIISVLCIIALILFIIYHKEIINWFFNDVLGNIIK